MSRENCFFFLKRTLNVTYNIQKRKNDENTNCNKIQEKCKEENHYQFINGIRFSKNMRNAGKIELDCFFVVFSKHDVVGMLTRKL